MNYRARYDWFVLKPLWAVFIILSVFYFARGEWVIGIFTLFMVFLFGIVGASLHKERTFSELASGYPHAEDSSSPSKKVMSEGDARALARASLRLMPLLIVAAVVLLIHHGMTWYWAAGIALLVGWLVPVVLIVPVQLLSRSKSTESPREEN